MVRVHSLSCLQVVGRFAQAFPALLLCLLASTVSFSKSHASHIIGGEIVKHLEGDAYEVTLIVYRDCNPSAADFDDPALIQFYGVSPGSSIVESLLSVEIPLNSNVINVPIVLGNRAGFRLKVFASRSDIHHCGQFATKQLWLGCVLVTVLPGAIQRLQ